MSLHVAERGEKDYLRRAWQGARFDLELACRTYGRNDAFWVLCYRRALAGEALPSGRELRDLVRSANTATGGLDSCGRPDRYTLYEARATVEQVSGYARAVGLHPLVLRGRRWSEQSRSRRATPPVRRLMAALCDVAERSGSYEFACSHRRLAEMAGVSACSVAQLLWPLVDAGMVRRVGFNRPLPGRAKGTSRFSLMPSRPEQRVDEERPPRFDYQRCRWVWDRPEDRGRTTRWAFARSVASVPTVKVITTPPPPLLIRADNRVLISTDQWLARGSP